MVHKSKTVYKDLNPFWDEKFELIVEDVSVPLDLKVKLILGIDALCSFQVNDYDYVLQVYDYDWGLRDDFMGQAQIILREDSIGTEEDVVVTLVESGQAEYLGQVNRIKYY